MDFPKLSPRLIKEKKYNKSSNILVPSSEEFHLPEKVLQFGTGALLRGLPDYYIDKANKRGLFNGRIVAVKSTDTPEAEKFKIQEGLYVHNIRGIKKDRTINEYIINSSISRVLESKHQWAEVLKCAHNPDLFLIISNTTEVGIVFLDENLNDKAPLSFPGKLTSFLYERFRAFGGAHDSGMIIIPTELIMDNAKKLKEIVITLSRRNQLGENFINWLEKSNRFCNSLVDRIVPGKPNAALKNEIGQELGFDDDLLIISEPYNLWAIEGDPAIKERLSFCKVDKGVVIEQSIYCFRERKLRLLNGTHSISVGLGYLAGLNTIAECMEEPLMEEFINNVMMDEMVPALDLERAESEAFANEVLERFKNPYIQHLLLNITLQYTQKMNVRNSKTIINFYKRYIEVPRYFALGFAGYLLFMKVEKVENGLYYGKRNDDYYLIQDELAPYFYSKWNSADTNTLNNCRLFVEEIIDDERLWDKELKAVTGFSDLVAHSLFELIFKGVNETLEEFVEFGEIEE